MLPYTRKVAYDALNRVTQVAYTDQTINFTHDSGTNGIGRLTGASDANHSMSWAYDTHGRVTGKNQIVASVTRSVGYGYTNGDLSSIVTPSGQTVTYGYTNHRITSITVNGTTTLSGVSYDPFGPANGWTWGDGHTETRTYNTDGNLSGVAMVSETLTVNYDNAQRISTLHDNYGSGYTWTLGYDPLDRLTSASKTGTAYGWTYDADGNRLTQTGTSASTFTPSGASNHVNSTTGALARTYAYDAAGNTKSYSNLSFIYNQRGRVSSVTGGTTAQYFYNAQGQLYQKIVGGTTTLLMYDEAGHLLGEYTSSGVLIQETIWMGDIPVATLRPNGSSISIYYVETDQLNAPRVIVRTSDHHPMWRWDPDPFGTAAPNQNPYGLGTFTYNLRFPGQYYQAETGLNYNYFRDYDPATGRYVESDPIGLAGGSYSTYIYGNNNPISNSDPSGLQAIPWPSPGPLVSPGPLFTPGSPESMHFADLVMQAAGQVADAIANACKTCPACTPYGKGTKGYIGPHTDHDHYPIGRPHLNLFEVNQNPSTCKCFWNKANPDAAAPPPQAGWVDLNSGFPPLSP